MYLTRFMEKKLDPIHCRKRLKFKCFYYQKDINTKQI